jgi:hypothetical protein
MQLKVRTNPQKYERRRHTRVQLSLPGRFMLENRQEFPCRTIDVSVGGLALQASARGEIGERIVAYFDELGRIEGNVVRHSAKGFAMTANMPATRRQKLANQLTWLINRDPLGLPVDRRHQRIAPKQTGAIIRLPDDSLVAAKILDLSASGAAVNCVKAAPLGSLIHIGRRRARVVRLFDCGMALEFTLPLTFDQFDENVVL